MHKILPKTSICVKFMQNRRGFKGYPKLVLFSIAKKS